MSEEKRSRDERERAWEAAELRRFAREHAGTELDLIPELASAAGSVRPRDRTAVDEEERAK